MSAAVEILVQILLLLVVVWIALMGGFGAMLARARGGSTLEGFTWGVLLGPVGWGAVVFRTRARSGGPRRMTGADWIRTEPASRTAAGSNSDDWLDRTMRGEG